MAAKDSVMLQKLKDGVQDTVVFLRMLEQCKIPAVLDTRRKKLLEKLVILQSDTIREVPPSFEDGDVFTEEKQGPTSPVRKEGAELRRMSSNVDAKVSEYAKMETRAKKEMDHESPKKKLASPTHAKSESTSTLSGNVEAKVSEYANIESRAKVEKKTSRKKGSDSTEQDKDKPVSQTAPAEEHAEKNGSVVSPEHTPSAANEPDGKRAEEEESGGGKKSGGKKKRFGDHLKGLKVTLGRSKKDTSAAVTAEQKVAAEQNGTQEGETVETETATAARAPSPSPSAEQPPQEEQKTEVEEEEEEKEEGVRIKSELEKRVPKRFGSGFNWVKISGKVKEMSLILTTGNKEKQLELVGCTVSSDATGNKIELFSHAEQKQWVFRVETEELRERWVEELQRAIDECPKEPSPLPEAVADGVEEKQEDGRVPEIKVDTVETEEGTLSKRKQSNVTASPARGKKAKPLNEVPDQGILLKGSVHRKKGTFGGWERAFCYVTYSAMYFTSGEDVREYHLMCPFNTGSGTVNKEKKGHDKQSEGLLVKSGKTKEILSLSTGELKQWKEVLENVLGLAGGCELMSEDEDDVEEGTGAPVPQIEDTYEELPGENEDDFGIEEAIYEEFDEVRTSPTPSPILPSRNEHKPAKPSTEPSPTLPPRNEISVPSNPAPSLPPRNSPRPDSKFLHAGTNSLTKTPTPQPKTAPQPAPNQQPEDEELYEDVVPPTDIQAAADIEEELYEDVVVPETETIEELYDDVVAGDTGGEEYTEMEAGVEVREEYVTMEPGGGGGEEEDEGGELYCEVDSEAPPPHAARSGAKTMAPPNTTTTTSKGRPFSSIQKPPPPATYVPKHSGSISHRPPKKSRFYEEWCTVEGTNLCTYKSQADKRSSEKIALSDYDFVYGPEQGGKFAFRLSKGEKVHHFNLQSKEALNDWVTAIRTMAKTATFQIPQGEQKVYEAIADHSAETDEQISFSKGAYLRVISEESRDWWIGQLGDDSQVFGGKIGKFPVSKVTLAESLYL